MPFLHAAYIRTELYLLASVYTIPDGCLLVLFFCTLIRWGQGALSSYFGAGRCVNCTLLPRNDAAPRRHRNGWMTTVTQRQGYIPFGVQMIPEGFPSLLRSESPRLLAETRGRAEVISSMSRNESRGRFSIARLEEINQFLRKQTSITTPG